MTIIYTDGSCVNVGQPHAKAGAGIYFGKNHPLNTSCSAVPGAQTNNRAEVWAVIRALQLSPPDQELEIRTDSMLTIKLATRQWKAKENLDLFSMLWELLRDRRVTFTWVKGHSTDPGNIAADQLAAVASALKTPESSTSLCKS